MFLSIFCVGYSRQAMMNSMTLRNKLWKNSQRHFLLCTCGICTTPSKRNPRSRCREHPSPAPTPSAGNKPCKSWLLDITLLR